MSRERGTSKGRSPSIGQKMHSTREGYLQTTGTKLLPSIPEDNSKVSQASYANIASSNLPNYVTTPLPQGKYPQVSGSTFQFSELVEEIASRLENLHHFQKFPFVTYAVRMSEYERNHEDLSACGRNSDESFRKAPSNERGIELGLHGQTENFRKHVGGGTSRQSEIGFEDQNGLHSSGKNQESNIASERFLNDQRMIQTTSEILATNHANSVLFPNSQNLYFQYNAPLQDISLKSGQLCPEVHRDIENDFAIRIFAHIAFLNQVSYRVTPSYSNMNVYKIVEFVWVEIKEYSFDETKCQMIDYENFRQNVMPFNEEFFDLFPFLRYCAMICQIGVQDMKCEVEYIQYHVITILRVKIKEVENALRSCFECIVENNAGNIVESFGL